jgi:DNA (cytosine-5)-methyltransferase 1
MDGLGSNFPDVISADLVGQTATSRTFYEFFAGGGLVRVGLGAGWTSIGAIDNDLRKAEVYRANFGGDGLVQDDIRNLKATDIEGVPDLAWASFPCTDISIAGTRSGLDGVSSGAFWPCWNTIRQLVDSGRGPPVIALENVRNLIASHDGKDFAAVVGAMVAAGYKVGALLIDARLFVPQSRKRIFVVGVRKDVPLPMGMVLSAPNVPFHPPDLVRVVATLPAAVKKNWIWWNLPVPEPSGYRLSDLTDPDSPETPWHTAAETAELLASMGLRDLERVDAAKASGDREVGTVYVRSRIDIMGRRRRANARMDGCASCLLTPNGRSSSQIILVVEGQTVRTRFMTRMEGARLMGLPATYRLPRSYTASFQLFGDGVVVPVIRHLAENLLEPLVDHAMSWRPRTGGAPAGTSPASKRVSVGLAETPRRPKLKERSGIKGATVGTTVYLVPEESKRVRRLALELDLSLHELLLQGLDRLLAENGHRPVERYERATRESGIAKSTSKDERGER